MPTIEELNAFFERFRPEPEVVAGVVKLPTELEPLLEEAKAIESRPWPTREDRERLREIDRALRPYVRAAFKRASRGEVG